MTQGERVRIIRKQLGLTLVEFGNKIGLKNNSVSQIENNKNSLTEQVSKLICSEFNINSFWLKEGKGEMFNIKKESSLDLLSKDYGLNEVDKVVIQRYLQLSKDDRKSINNFILGISNK